MRFSKRLGLFSIFLAIIFTALYLYYKEGNLPIDKNSQIKKIFVIKRREPLSTIARRLEESNLIRSKLVFYLVVKKLGIEKKIQAGDFYLSPSMSTQSIAKHLTKGTLDVWLTVIEGLRKEEIAHLVADKLNFPESAFIKKSKEGYLFPDTYLFPRSATVGAIIKIFQQNFNKKFNNRLRAKARQNNLTNHEVITIASLVEREAKSKTDKNEIASIILKRYHQNWPLQIDATIQYALGYQPKLKTWWKPSLTKQDLNLNSPYNSYQHPGLPPTPICNPGLASIKAVVNANEKTPYWYYLSDKKGFLHFSKTLKQHNQNIKKYLH